jgi:outer membrane protein OmpA-like peptidoglycan-associated protein
LRQQRQERVEDAGRRIVIEEPDKRRIVREEGKTFIHHDETERFRRLYGDVRTERRGDVNVNVVVRTGGVQIFTDFDDDGRPLRRYRRDPDGREFVFFDNRDYYRRARRHTFLDAIIDLAPPIIRIPRERYIVDYDRASDDDIYYALNAPPVERLERTYSLEEVRYSRYLRDRMPRVDLDTINFDFGSWEVEPYQYGKLERVAHVINRILDRQPDEMFLIEGHTDAVGSDEDNLSLSDRRAEAVAEILSREFGVPAENLTTQGYGEQFLKIDTLGPERANRRVAVRRITPLLSRSDVD